MNYKQKFIYRDVEIKVEVEFKKRKHISLIVFPDLRVVARAPFKTKTEKISSIIQKRLNWIANKLDYFNKLEPRLPPKEFVSGETHYFLGKPYILKIEFGEKAKLKIADNFLKMKLPVTDDKIKAQKIMMSWYSAQAKELIPERVSKYLPIFLEMGANNPEIRFRKMKRRWGSCSNKNVVILNTELIKSSFYCIDYVVVHELCHLIHHGHNKKFYKLLQAKMQDWKERKKQLERTIII